MNSTPRSNRQPTPLTDRAVRGLKPDPRRARAVADGMVPWLAVRVTPNGKKSWTLGYRIRGRARRLGLGQYPTIGVAEARKKARHALAQVENGVDPALEKQDARTAPTVADLVELYVAAKQGEKRSLDADEQMFRSIILPKWKDIAVRDITRRDVRALLATVAQGRRRDAHGDLIPAPVRRNRVGALISTLFNFAVSEDIIIGTPASGIKKAPGERKRERYLDDEEIRELLTACEAIADGTAPEAIPALIAIGLQVILFTAQRPGEVFRVERAELELPPVDAVVQTGLWTIPSRKTKNKLTHQVPLTPPVIALLRAAIARSQADNKFVFGGIKGGSVAARAAKALPTLRRAGAIERDADYTRHDLRRTASTLMAAAGISRETIDRVTNHIRHADAMAQIYDRYSYLPEKRVALETLARRLDAIQTESASATVVPFAPAR
jgi:integrase